MTALASSILFFLLIGTSLLLTVYSLKLKRHNAAIHGQIIAARKEIRSLRRTSLKTFNDFKIGLLEKRKQPVTKILFLPVYEEVVLLPQKKSLLMHAHENGIGVPSACLGISQCGTCKVKIMSGAENVTPRAKIEKEVMEMYDLDPSVRFTCMMRPKGDMVVQIYPEQKLFDTVGIFPTDAEIEEDGLAFGVKCVEQLYK